MEIANGETKKKYEGKIIEANGKDWLILRKPREKYSSYQYEVYEWNPTDPSHPEVKRVEESVGFMKLCTKNDMLGLRIWWRI